MIIDGRKMAAETLARAKTRAEKLARRPEVVALIVGHGTQAMHSYLAIKQKRATDAGCAFNIKQFNIKQFDISSGINDSVLLAQVVDSSREADSLIVQLPLPTGVDTKVVCDAIPIVKDADVLSSVARARFETEDIDALFPPVVGAAREILRFGNVEPKGKRAVVIGNGWLVGNPCAIWLRQQCAEVTVLDMNTMPEEFTEMLRAADIVISGAGSPHFIKPDMIKQGVVWLDAGTSESNGALAGDADPACAEKCSIFTPVPGGIGSLAVAKLFENVVTLAERSNSAILSS